MSRREALIDRLKLVGAGLFVVGGLFGFIVFIPENYPSWLIGALALVVLIAFLALTLVLFKASMGGRAVGNTAGLGGHLKTGHTWTLQKRPTERNQNKIIYTLRESFGQTFFRQGTATDLY